KKPYFDSTRAFSKFGFNDKPLGCARSDGKKPDGLTLVPWRRGRSVLWDFTCSDTFAPSHLQSTSAAAGAAARAAEHRKRSKYAHLENRFTFVPVAVESMGVWGEEGRRFVRELGFKVAVSTSEPKAPTYLMQRISLAVQRGNVASVLGTLPSGPSLEEVFYVLNVSTGDEEIEAAV